MSPTTLRRVLGASVVLACVLPAAAVSSATDPARPSVGSPSATPDEVRSIVSEMMNDAEARSSLLAGGTSGHDGKFFLASPDGAFRLNIGGQLQSRYTMNWRDDHPSDDFSNGFSLPRTRVIFDGNVIDPTWTYRIMLDFKPSNGTGFLQDAWIGKKLGDSWTIRGGQGTTWFMREWNQGDSRGLTTDRSLQSLVFGQARSQFVDAKYVRDNLTLVATFSDGFRSVNTDFNTDPSDYAFTVRGEWKLSGDWKALNDGFWSPRGSAFSSVIGGAAHFEQGPNTGAPGVDEQKLFAWTGDVLLKGDGWNAMLAGVGYHVADEAGVTGADFNDFGVLVQGGVFVSEKAELIARYDVILPDSDRAANDSFSTFLIGLNYYFAGHAVKFCSSLAYYPDPTTDTKAGNFANTGASNPSGTSYSVLPSTGDQVALTLQFQILF